MMNSRGMGVISPSKVPRAKRRGDNKPVIGTNKPIKTFKKGGVEEEDDDRVDYARLNARILKALIKRYGSDAKAREVMRVTDGGELLRIMREEEAKKGYAEGGKVKSKVNQSGNYTKPGMRKSLFESIKARAVQGTGAGQWSARKAQLLAKTYKSRGGGYK